MSEASSAGSPTPRVRDRVSYFISVLIGLLSAAYFLVFQAAFNQEPPILAVLMVVTLIFAMHFGRRLPWSEVIMVPSVIITAGAVYVLLTVAMHEPQVKPVASTMAIACGSVAALACAIRFSPRARLRSSDPITTNPEED